MLHIILHILLFLYWLYPSWSYDFLDFNFGIIDRSLILKINKHHKINNQSIDDYLERGLMSFTNPFVIKSLPYIDGKGIRKNSFAPNSSGSTRSQFYSNSKEGKIKPKRFFGGFLSGAVTILEMAIKVNIPIPFCQFPNSPCKPWVTIVHLHSILSLLAEAFCDTC